jgi:hypothetical protein
MSFKLSKTDIMRRATLTGALRLAADALQEAANAYNDAAQEAMAFVNDRASTWREEFDQRSEAWQDGDEGQTISDLIDSWENVDHDEVVVPDGSLADDIDELD